jgi:type I restriction enzyme S subunit
MENRKTFKLRELVELKSGFAFKGTDFISAGVPVIKIKNVKPGKVILDSLSYVSREVADRTQKFRVLPNDILITMSGNRIDGTPETWVGKVSLFRHTGEFLLNQRVGVLKVKDTNKVSEVFLSILLSSEDYQHHFISKATSSGGQANISPSLIYDTEVAIPPIEEQKVIAKIFSSLDGKIELNRRMNATLEAIVRALFKAWFVNFEPVHANRENRTSESVSPDVAKLFPNEFENGIPKGWRIRKIREILEAKGGATPSTKNSNFWNGDRYWATPKDLSNLASPVLLNTERKITDEGVKQISSGILPSGTLLLSSRAPIGYVAISQIPVSINQGFIAIQAKELSNLYMLYWLMQHMEIVKNRANGSTFQEISKSSFREIELIVPDNSTLKLFDEKVASVFERIVSNEKETLRLEQIRNSLLPRLISGKIPVTQLENKMEDGTE